MSAKPPTYIAVVDGGGTQITAIEAQGVSRVLGEIEPPIALAVWSFGMICCFASRSSADDIVSNLVSALAPKKAKVLVIQAGDDMSGFGFQAALNSIGRLRALTRAGRM
jgi:hypothetical protein